MTVIMQTCNTLIANVLVLYKYKLIIDINTYSACTVRVCMPYCYFRDCIRSRDPHCVWDTSINGGKCVFNTLTDSGSSGEGTVPSK